MEATPTTETDPNTITVVDQNGKTDSIKTEIIDNMNLNDIQTISITRASARLKSTNPIYRYGNPVTF